jgi:hypothetical protein
MRGYVVVHFPFRPELVASDGVRIRPAAEEEAGFVALLREGGLPFHTLRGDSVADRLREVLAVIVAHGAAL